MLVRSIICSSALTVIMGTLTVPAASAAGVPPPVSSAPAPNRTYPKIDPPSTGLDFPAEPGLQDFFRARVFEEPLVPVGGEPTAAENKALASALLGYSKRSGPDDFSSLTDFLHQHPQSPWSAALLTDLGLEYYHTAHYSLALDAWAQAWALAKNAAEPKAHALADRAFGELIYMNARLGRMDEMQALLKAIEQRPVMGPAAGRADNARSALWMMQHRPEISFRCGPLALRSIRLALGRDGSSDAEVFELGLDATGLFAAAGGDAFGEDGTQFPNGVSESRGGVCRPVGGALESGPLRGDGPKGRQPVLPARPYIWQYHLGHERSVGSRNHWLLSRARGRLARGLAQRRPSRRALPFGARARLAPTIPSTLAAAIPPPKAVRPNRPAQVWRRRRSISWT